MALPEILKYNLKNNIFEDKLLIGQQSAEYPLAQGSLGNDNIISCGSILKTETIYMRQYYIISI